VETADGDRYRSSYVVAATKNEVGYLDGLDGVDIVKRGKQFVETDGRGRTGVEGLYAAGRLAQKPHQTVVSAGHGAEVAVTLLEDDDRPFYHDWVAPEGYFTGRGIDVPPGVEEIDDAHAAGEPDAAPARGSDAVHDGCELPDTGADRVVLRGDDWTALDRTRAVSERQSRTVARFASLARRESSR
jgi:hypothetical protein